MSAAAFPPPPPYYRLYADYSDDPSSAPPPPAPLVGTYVQYGSTYTTTDMLPGLEEEGLRQLYPSGSDVDYKKELRALNRELILQFLELTDALIERPSQSARCVEDMTLILRNIHHLLNSLRPHQMFFRLGDSSNINRICLDLSFEVFPCDQARATVIHMLETQLTRRKEALADVRRKRAEARAILQGCSATL